MRRPLVAAAACTLLLLASCSTPLPEPSPEPAPAAAPAAVTVDQVERVLADVQQVIADADAAQDAEILRPRVDGPARVTRTAQYRLAPDDSSAGFTEIPEDVQTVMVPTTDEWPRTVMTVTEAPEDLQAPLVLTLVQDDPRSPYRLWSWVRLFQGVEMPATLQPEVGSTPVEPGAEELAVSIPEVLARYVDVVEHADASAAAGQFTEDPLRAGIQQTRQAFAQLVEGKGQFTETYEVTDDVPRAIGTADGGAIVVGAFRTTQTITLDDSTLTIGDDTAHLLGKTTVTQNLGITWLSVVAFAVPPAGSEEPITVLGAEHTRTEVTGE